MQWLEREFPSWVPRYERMYTKKYAPEDYRKQVQATVRLLQQRHGISKRADVNHDARPDEPLEPEQVGFAW
jgi:hypothetical protein